MPWKAATCLPPERALDAKQIQRGNKMTNDEMDEALMTFVNCLGAVIMVSLVGFHYLTASAKDADN